MFRSRDGGTSWTPIGGEAPHPDLIVLAPDYANPGRILVGTAGRGVWSLDTKAAGAAPPPPSTPKKAAPAGSPKSPPKTPKP